ncbi:aminotransferase class I/II-fold pyridoxal phosphate-dependent enzyme [Acetivibrio sp. MSJd-27]|nr:aminotransferase class I/II-fold pyridoxal phosphate-dependent enzyme [Acetivibrio sp. MSJd-27]
MEDAISLGVGEPDFVTPWHIRQAGIESLKKGHTYYTSNWGLFELRQEISRYMERKRGVHYDPADEILVTVGGSEALDLAIRALISPGDEVLIPEPCFVCYKPCVTLCGGVPVTIETKMEDQFKLTPELLRKSITPKTKLLVLTYPNNPTGAVMTKGDLERIIPIIEEHNLMVISDEIYGELTYSGEHTSITQFENMRDRTILINGFSKTYAMTGWRLGFTCAHRDIVSVMTKIHQFAIMSSPTTSQYSAIEALKNGDEDVAYMKKEYNYRRRYLVDALNKIGLDCFEPFGAFYVFPSIRSTKMTSVDFCEQLLMREKVAVIPGTAFGECGEGHIRISYAYSLDQLKAALERIEKFINNLSKNGDRG